MRRTIWLLAGVLLAPVALGSDSPKEYDDKTEVVGIEGTWRMVDDEKNVTTFHRGTWTADDGDGDPWHGTYSTDTKRKPPHLTRYYINGSFRGRTLKYIYQVDGDTLKIASIPNMLQYPQGFDDAGIGIYTYKRVK